MDERAGPLHQGRGRGRRVRRGGHRGLAGQWCAPLLDAHDPDRRGGTGRTIDWDAAARAARTRRIILAGGLDASNIRDAIARAGPFAVDVSSGVEREPGVKDAARLRAFVEGVAAADAAQVP